MAPHNRLNKNKFTNRIVAWNIVCSVPRRIYRTYLEINPDAYVTHTLTHAHIQYIRQKTARRTNTRIRRQTEILLFTFYILFSSHFVVVVAYLLCTRQFKRIWLLRGKVECALSNTLISFRQLSYVYWHFAGNIHTAINV